MLHGFEYHRLDLVVIFAGFMRMDAHDEIIFDAVPSIFVLQGRVRKSTDCILALRVCGQLDRNSLFPAIEGRFAVDVHQTLHSCAALVCHI